MQNRFCARQTDRQTDRQIDNPLGDIWALGEQVRMGERGRESRRERRRDEKEKGER